MGQFYTITLYFEVGHKKQKKITFIDSLKIIPIIEPTIIENKRIIGNLYVFHMTRQ